LTKIKRGVVGEGKAFATKKEVYYALEFRHIAYQALIKVKIDGAWIETTAGRIIFSDALGSGIAFQNQTFGEKELRTLIEDVYVEHGASKLVQSTLVLIIHLFHFNISILN
jgi:DNA-directed RNA polymerase subunit beta'